MTFCAKCGKMLADTDLFCGNCGAKNPMAEQAVKDETIIAVDENTGEIIAEPTPEQVVEEIEVEASADSDAENDTATPEESAEEAAQPAEEFVPEPVKVEFDTEPEAPKKKGSAGWLALGLFFPLVGLILFLFWRKKNPRSAKFVGIGAIIGGILEIIAYIVLIFFIIFALIISSAGVGYSPDMFGELTDMAISWIVH